MKKLFFLIIVKSALIIGANSLFAGDGALSWQQEKLEQQAAWSDKELVYSYQFENKGDKTVTLRDLATSCGCTELDRSILKSYKPGEKGTLMAKYVIGGKTGQRIEKLMVESDEDGGSKVYELLLIANLPVLIKSQPAFVHWQSGDPVSAKSIKLAWQGPDTAEFVSATPAEKDWQVKVVPVVSGKSWSLQVTPPTTDGNVIVPITLIFKNPQTGEREFTVYGMLQPAP